MYVDKYCRLATNYYSVSCEINVVVDFDEVSLKLLTKKKKKFSKFVKEILLLNTVFSYCFTESRPKF